MRDLEDIEMRGASVAELVPGAMDVIEWTEKNKVPWAVVSRNCRRSILLASKTISFSLPGIVRSRDDGDSVKPDPAALVETCRELGVNPAQTLLIGDYIYDMIGARRAGMRGVLVREKIDSEWAEWLEYSCPSMAALRAELDNPSETIPWEYQETAGRNGRDFLRRVSRLTALVPGEPLRGLDSWLTRAAVLGVCAFAVPDVLFQPRAWKTNPSFDPSSMGTSLLDTVESFLRARFPLARTAAYDGGRGCVELPYDPDEIEGFLVGLADGDG
jgi:hypothetical protein